MTLIPFRADVAIVVGHTPDRPGAVAGDGLSEWQWGHTLAQDLHGACERIGLEPVVASKRTTGTYRERVADVIRRLQNWKPRCLVELHFNAHPEGSDPRRFGGSMGLHWPGSGEGARMAALTSAACAQAIGHRDRGAIPQARSWNGPPRTDSAGRPVPGGPPLYILKDTPYPAVILETHLGTLAEEHARAREALRDNSLAEAIAAALHRFCSGSAH